MVKHNIRIFAFAILWLAFIVYAIIFVSTQNLDSIDFQKAITHISTTISINIVIWMIFITWAWKWKIFYPWLVPFPNLSGNWVGTVKSNWKEKQLEPIPIEISIIQNFFNIQVKIKTNESRSYSIGASFDIDTERGFQQLFYSYLNTPKSGVRERSEMHYGSTILNFDGFKVEKMDGEYWTDRETTGEITLEKRTTYKIETVL
jgi:SMODS-associating 2TM, beta-strand rich effector domain